MKFNSKYIALVLAALFTLFIVSSCIDTLTNFEIKSQPPKVVLNGILEPDSIIKVHIHQSVGIDENFSNKVISNARVEIFENSTLIGTLEHLENGYYVLDNYYPKVLATYRIEAQVGNMPLAWAETTIPKHPVVKDVVKSYRFNVPERGCSGCSPNDKFNMEIKLDSDGNELYYIAVSAIGSRYRIDYGVRECDEVVDTEFGYTYYTNCIYPEPDTLGVFNEMIAIGTYDKRNSFLKNTYGSGMGRYVLSYFDYEEPGIKQYFSNKHFRNEALNINVDIVSNRLYNYLDSEFDLWVYRYDEEYYKFLLSLARRNETGSDDLFSEKVSTYSNVENGLGMLGSASGTLIKVEYDLEEFER